MMITKISKVIAVKILGKSIKFWKARIKHDVHGIISYRLTYLTYNLFIRIMKHSTYDM